MCKHLLIVRSNCAHAHRILAYTSNIILLSTISYISFNLTTKHIKDLHQPHILYYFNYSQFMFMYVHTQIFVDLLIHTYMLRLKTTQRLRDVSRIRSSINDSIKEGMHYTMLFSLSRRVFARKTLTSSFQFCDHLRECVRTAFCNFIFKYGKRQ